jgi:uracil phosphoribosyltransferase
MPAQAQNVVLIDHPVIQTKLTELRDYTTDHRKFRALLDEIASFMVYEVTRDWPTTAKPVQTPLERATGRSSSASRSAARPSGRFSR